MAAADNKSVVPVITGIDPKLVQERANYSFVPADGVGNAPIEYILKDGSTVRVLRLDLYVDDFKQAFTVEMSREQALDLRNRIDRAFGVEANDVPGYM